MSELFRNYWKDALIVSTLLKISNSAMFGFRSKVETPNRAVSLLVLILQYLLLLVEQFKIY